MVLSARNPGGSIRPILGSLFAAPQYGRTPETLEMEEEGVSRGRPESLVTPSPDTPRAFENPKPERARPESLVAPHPDTSRVFETPKPEPRPAASGIPPFQSPAVVPGRVPQNEDFDPISEERTSFKPLVARDQQEKIEKRAVRSASIVELAETSARGKASEHPQPLLEQTEQKTVFKGPLRPITVEHLRRADPKTFRVAPHPIAGTNEARDLSGRAGMPAREPDEIQIHIGRIEVAAVPRPSVAATPKRAPQGPSLQEYLKQRDRSVR